MFLFGENQRIVPYYEFIKAQCGQHQVNPRRHHQPSKLTAYQHEKSSVNQNAVHSYSVYTLGTPNKHQKNAISNVPHSTENVLLDFSKQAALLIQKIIW